MLPWYDERAATDRLAFACLLALTVHAAFILGISFSAEERQPPPRSLDVTLAHHPLEQPDETAEFLAQANQQGSGTEALASDPTTPFVSPFSDPEIHEPLVSERSLPDEQSAEHTVIESLRSDRQTPEATQEDSRHAVEPLPIDGDAERPNERELASLAARLDAQRRAYAELPRVHRITSVATRQATDAAYLFGWKQRVELVGNQNYPPEARRRRLYGDLRLLVALLPDGSVREIRVLQSSGYRVLDDAAARIVRLAAPFEPFPAELRAEADVLEIIRTWQFRSDRLTSSD